MFNYIICVWYIKCNLIFSGEWEREGTSAAVCQITSMSMVMAAENKKQKQKEKKKKMNEKENLPIFGDHEKNRCYSNILRKEKYGWVCWIQCCTHIAHGIPNKRMRMNWRRGKCNAASSLAHWFAYKTENISTQLSWRKTKDEQKKKKTQPSRTQLRQQ